MHGYQRPCQSCDREISVVVPFCKWCGSAQGGDHS